MRRHSLIGPLILVLIGALFLAHNLHPEWVPFDLIATYWPFLLIAWGLLRLVEVLYWKFSSQPMPARGVSGGEWTLIVFICLIGSGLFLWHEHGSRLPRVFVGGRGVEIFGESFDYPIAEQRQTVKAARILVDNARGNTRIVGADTQEVKVSGRRTVRAYNQSQADEANQKTALNVSTEGDQLVIRSTQGAERDEMRISTDLEITVPRGATHSRHRPVWGFRHSQHRRRRRSDQRQCRCAVAGPGRERARRSAPQRHRPGPERQGKC